jgi:hypothetical protein
VQSVLCRTASSPVHVIDLEITTKKINRRC